MDTNLKRVVALRQFVEHVPGVGMVVAKPARDADAERERPARKANIVTLTADQARKRVAKGDAEYADPIGADGEGADVVAEPKTQRERRLAARALRRGGADPLDHDRDGKKGGSERGARSTAAKGRANASAKPSDGKKGGADFNAGAFAISAAEGIGMYEITGPGLDAPEKVKGKAKAQERLDELNSGRSSSAADDSAPVD